MWQDNNPPEVESHKRKRGGLRPFFCRGLLDELAAEGLGFAGVFNKIRRFFRSALFRNSVLGCVLAFLLAAGVYYFVSILGEQRQEYRDKLAELEQCERDVAQVRTEITVLEKKQARLQRPEGVKDVAREKLGMVAKGEIAYIVDGAPSMPAKPAGSGVVAGTCKKGHRPSGFFFSLFSPIIF